MTIQGLAGDAGPELFIGVKRELRFWTTIVRLPSAHTGWRPAINDNHLPGNGFSSAKCNDLLCDVLSTTGSAQDSLAPSPLFRDAACLSMR